MIRPAVLSLLLVLAFAAPASAAADVKPLLGEADGLSLVGRPEAQQLRFAPSAKRLYRSRLAGRRVTIRCFDERETRAGAFQNEGEYSSTVRLPRRPRPVRLGQPREDGYDDWCRLSRRKVPIAILPGTDVGRRFLDELTASGRLAMLAELVSPGADDDPDLPVPADRVVERTRGLFLALEGPDATPPPGKAGYWTDGIRSVIAATTLGGKRLFTDRSADSTTVTSNLGLPRGQREYFDAFLLWRTADT